MTTEMATNTLALVTDSDDEEKQRATIKTEPDDTEEIKVLLWNVNGPTLKKPQAAHGFEATKPQDVVAKWPPFELSKEPSREEGEVIVSKEPSREEGEVIEVLAKGLDTAARHAMVSEEIKAIMPDVLLLQETTTKLIIDEIQRALGEKYEAVSPFREEGFRENISKEAQVLYNPEKFEKEELKVTLLRDAVDDLDKAETEYQVGLRCGENCQRAHKLGLLEEKGWSLCWQMHGVCVVSQLQHIRKQQRCQGLLQDGGSHEQTCQSSCFGWSRLQLRY